MLSDQKFELRAYGAMSALIQTANLYSEKAWAKHPVLAELPAPKQGQVMLLAMLTLLFDGQQFFWDHVIAEKESAGRFEKFFYTVFYKVTGVNPSRRLKEHRAHVEAKGDEGRVTFLGEKVTSDVLGAPDADLTAQLSLLYADVLKNYWIALAQVWETPDEALQESKAALTQPGQAE